MKKRSLSSDYRTGEVTDRLSARSVQLWVRSAEPPGESRYENWTPKNKEKVREKEKFIFTTEELFLPCVKFLSQTTLCKHI